MTPPERIAIEYTVWEICQGLRLKLEECPEAGMREQLMNNLDAIVRQGGPRLIVGWS